MNDLKPLLDKNWKKQSIKMALLLCYIRFYFVGDLLETPPGEPPIELDATYRDELKSNIIQCLKELEELEQEYDSINAIVAAQLSEDDTFNEVPI